MNLDQMQGKWKQMKGEVKTRWGKLTDDDLTSIEGNKDQLVGRVQERYGIKKEQAQQQVDDWYKSFDESNEKEKARLDRKAS